MQVCADFPSYSRQVVLLPLKTALHVHHNYSHSKLPIPFCLYILIGRTIGSLFNQLRKRLVPSKQVVRILCQQHCLPSPRHISLTSFYSSSLSSFPFPVSSICVGCLIMADNQLVYQEGVEHASVTNCACMHDSCYDIPGVNIPMTEHPKWWAQLHPFRIFSFPSCRVITGATIALENILLVHCYHAVCRCYYSNTCSILY